MASLDDSLIGKTIDGRFRVVRHLGTGGMGTAFEASQRDLNRPVCLKFLKSDALTSLDSVNRFKREARVLASLQHKNIVECFAFGIYDKVYPYLVLEFVEGLSLNALTQKETLHWTRAVSLVIQVCEALTYAHQNGFIHRDIKPANVMVTREADNTELVKVVDFGLVGKKRGEFVFDTLTDPRSIIGSVNYMSPEAFKGAVSDVSLDVYATGCLLYETLSGKIPFEAENPIAVMFKHTKERLPELPSSIKPDAARYALNDLIRKATDSDPSARLQTCDQIRTLLIEILESELGASPLASGVNSAPTSQPQLQNKNSTAGVAGGKSLLLLLAGIVAISTVILTQSNHRDSAPQVRQSFALGNAYQQRTGQNGDADQKIEFSSALGQFHSLVKELDQTGAENTEQKLSPLRKFLEHSSIILSNDDAQVRKLTEDACAKLVKLRATTKDDSLRTLFFATQCDLLTSFRYYENTLALLKSPDSTAALRLQKGSINQLRQLHDFVFIDTDADSDPKAFLIERLRPAAFWYPEFKDDGKRFIQLVSGLMRLNSPDNWSPNLVSIASRVMRNHDSDLMRLWLNVALIAVKSDQPTSARALLPRIREYLPKHPLEFVDSAAELYDKLGQTEEALATIEKGCEAARRRGDHYRWCLWRVSTVRILIDHDRQKEAKLALNSVLNSEQWTPEDLREKPFMWFDLTYRYAKLSLELEESSTFIQFYKQAQKMRSAEPEFEHRCCELSIDYAKILWCQRRTKEADVIIEQELARENRSDRLQIPILLCEKAVTSSAGTAKLRIWLLSKSIGVLSTAIAKPGPSETVARQRAKRLLVEASVSLANVYGSMGDVGRAKTIYTSVLKGEFGELTSEHERLGFLINLSALQQKLAEFREAQHTVEEIIDIVCKIPDRTESDYEIFQAALAQYALSENSNGDLHRAQLFLERQCQKFGSKPTPQKCHMLLLLSQSYLWGALPRPDLSSKCLEQSEKCYDLLPAPATEDTLHRGLQYLIAVQEMALGFFGRAKARLESILHAPEKQSDIIRLDAYCRLAELAFYSGELGEAQAFLNGATAQSALEQDILARIIYVSVDIFCAKVQYQRAVAALDKSAAALSKLKDANSREVNLIGFELWYAKVFLRRKCPAEARSHLQKASMMLEFSKKRGNPHLGVELVGGLYGLLSKTAELSNQPKLAADYQRAMLVQLSDPYFSKLWGKNNCSYATVLCNYRLGMLYRRQNQDDKALPYLLKTARVRCNRDYLLELAEVQAALGHKSGATRNYEAALSQLSQYDALNNSRFNFEKARVYASYACWLHDEGKADEAQRYAKRAVSLLDGNPSIYNRYTTCLPPEQDSLYRNLQRLAKWYPGERNTVQKLIAAVQASTDH